MSVRSLSFCLTLTLALIGARTVFAGDFFEQDGVALRGYDPVAYFTDNKPEKGLAKYAYEYKGSKFLFASAKNEQAFATNPEKYAPQFGGFCAFGTANGVKATTQPDAFSVVDGKLYLNHDTNVQKRWKEDVDGNISLGEKNWPEVSKAPLMH
ncbi:MAG TPA: YHS domain-containing (seleno)protein [Povalibacter sp.]|nr:YHS domain-containing (seleno)protein [Povalibacter sp.]